MVTMRRGYKSVFHMEDGVFRLEGNTDSGSNLISSVSLLCGRSDEGRGRQRRGSERIFSVLLNRETFFEDVRKEFFAFQGGRLIGIFTAIR
jgi:hypothetical protein